jgi:hypothetical protein
MDWFLLRALRRQRSPHRSQSPKGFTMADNAKSPSQIRLALAQFLFAQSIDVETLYKALGADITSSDNEAVSHMAGIIDGVTMATSKIRAHGLDNWTKG